MSDVDRIQSELEDAVAEREEKARLVGRLETSTAQLREVDGRVAVLRQKLDSETADVERLESFSAARIWAKLKGSHEGDLERETAEREAARYAVAEAESRRETLQRDHAALESRIAALGDVEGRYRSAMAAKEGWVTERGGAAAAELAEITERRGALLARDRQRREALAVGSTAEELLGEAAHELLQLTASVAGPSSAWDSGTAAGLERDLTKHEKLDRATQTLRRVDRALQSFSRELADIDLPRVDGARVEQMTRTFGFWFESILSSMAVRARVEDSRRRVDDAARQVQHTLVALRRTGRDLDLQLAELDERRERLLLG